MKKITAILLAAALFMAGCEKAAYDWQITAVDFSGDAGQYSSAAAGPDGEIHIASFGQTGTEMLGDYELPYGDLVYAHYKDGAWEAYILEQAAGMTPRIDTDMNGAAHIIHSKLGAHSPENLTDLLYTSNKSGDWKTEAISPTVVKGSDASIAVDADGYVHISAYNNEGGGTTDVGAAGGLRYITNAGGGWEWHDVDTEAAAGNDGDIAVDANGNVHISYLDKSLGLKYATNSGGFWEVTLVDAAPNVGWNTSIAVDGGGAVHISYSDPAPMLDPPGKGCLKYATDSSGEWEYEAVDCDGAGAFTGLTLGGNGEIIIAYYAYKEGGFTGRLKLAVKDGNGWSVNTVDDAQFVGLFCAADTSPEGDIAISYYDYINKQLRCAVTGR